MAIVRFDVTELRKDTTAANGLQLVEGEFVVGHWIKGVVEVFPPDEHTISRINGLGDDRHQTVL